MKAEQTTLDKIRSRPRFKMLTNLSQEEYETNLKNYLQENSGEFSGNINKEVATISVKTENDDYWKPYLSLRIEIEDEQTAIRGVFGPSNSVWTFFMFLYFLWIVLWMTFFTMWFVEKQINSNDFPWALPASFVTLFLIFATYFGARFGQNKAKKEMQKLRKFAEESTFPFEVE